MDSKARGVLDSTDRFERDSIPVLENCILTQIQESQFNLEVSLALVKLYQFFPSSLNFDVLIPLLVQMLANSQEQGFSLAMYMIPDSVQQHEKVAPLIALSDLVELGRFSEFWTLLEQHKGLIGNLPKFEESMRNFIVQVFLRSSKSVAKDFLISSLGLNEQEFQDFLASRDWAVADNQIKFPQGAIPVQKPAHEKIEFSQFGQIMQSLAS